MDKPIAIRKYELVITDNYSRLIEAVNELMNIGYVPCGGCAVGSENGKPLYTQTLVLNDNNDIVDY